VRRRIGRLLGTCRHAAPVFQATEHNLDPVAAFVSTLVVFDGLGSGLTTWDAGLYPLVL
jgi:hypothetical protein